MKKFKDIAHLFVGYKIALADYRLDFPLSDKENIYTIEWANSKQFKVVETDIVYDWGGTFSGKINDKIIVRPLSSMTEEEKVLMMQQKHKADVGNGFSHAITDQAYRVQWAIEHFFDLFNLIENGEAIELIKH